MTNLINRRSLHFNLIVSLVAMLLLGYAIGYFVHGITAPARHSHGTSLTARICDTGRVGQQTVLKTDRGLVGFYTKWAGEMVVGKAYSFSTYTDSAGTVWATSEPKPAPAYTHSCN